MSLSATSIDLLATLYLRISDMTDTSTSIVRQEREGRRKAELIEATVAKVRKDEDKSAFHAHVERPGWEDSLNDLRTGATNCLIVFKVDRATRQGIPQAAEIIRIVYETGCRFISIMDGIDSRQEGWELQLVLVAHQARQESKNTSSRVTNTREYERDMGRWMGHRPYGFIVTPERKLELHPQESEVVRHIAKMLLGDETANIEPKSRRAVARWLNEKGYDSPRWASRKQRIEELERKGEPLKAQRLREKPLKVANSWADTTVVQLVISPVMAGYIPHEGVPYRHSETGELVRVGPELLPMATLTRLWLLYGVRVPYYTKRKQIATPLKSSETSRVVRGTLTDFLHCGECGSRMNYDDALKRNGRPIPRYRCLRRTHGGKCAGSSMYAKDADRLVAYAVLNRISSLEPDDPAVEAIAQRWADQEYPDHAQRRSELTALIQDEESYLDRLEEEKLNGLFVGTRGEERFRRRYQDSNQRLTSYEKELTNLPDNKVLEVGFIHLTEEMELYWQDAPLAEKRTFLGLTLEKVWLSKARATGVRPTIDRLKFWYVGEPEPTNLKFSSPPSDSPA